MGLHKCVDTCNDALDVRAFHAHKRDDPYTVLNIHSFLDSYLFLFSTKYLIYCNTLQSIANCENNSGHLFVSFPFLLAHCTTLVFIAKYYSKKANRKRKQQGSKAACQTTMRSWKRLERGRMVSCTRDETRPRDKSLL